MGCGKVRWERGEVRGERGWGTMGDYILEVYDDKEGAMVEDMEGAR